MKKSLILSMALCAMIVSSGCVVPGDQGYDPIQHRQDIHFFVKTATRIALSELQPSSGDLAVLQSYLEAAKDLLKETGPDLGGLRGLAEELLPDEHKIVGFTILDVIERYVMSTLPNPDENQAQALKLITAGVDGAIGAIQEYQNINS